MPKANVTNLQDRIVLKIPCRYEGQTTKRFGETAIRFRIEEDRLHQAMRAVIGTDRIAAAIIRVKKTGEKLPVGRVQFGGLRIDGRGESVLTLDTVAEALQLPITKITSLADEDITLIMAIKVRSKRNA